MGGRVVGERFLITGEHHFRLQVDRNYSYCTICSGLFIDVIEAPGVPRKTEKRRDCFVYEGTGGKERFLDIENDVDSTGFEKKVATDYELLDRLKMLRKNSPVGQAAIKFVYASIADRLEAEVKVVSTSPAERKYQIGLREHLMCCYESLNRYSHRDALRSEIDAMLCEPVILSAKGSSQ